MLKEIKVVYFSPTGGTERAALCLAGKLAENIKKMELSETPAEELVFQSGDIVLFTVPVFAGRVAGYAAEKLMRCRGNGARAITAVVYGNRAFDDALLELNDCLAARGFALLSSAALIAEHSMLRAVAAGRPDARDNEQMETFARRIREKLERGAAAPAPVVPGNRPYTEAKPLPAFPAAGDACIKCGLCSERCPAGAIPAETPDHTDREKCIVCMRCIAVCPQKARQMPSQALEMLEQRLSSCRTIRRENELFL